MSTYPVPAQDRVSRNLQVLGVLWLVAGVLEILPGLALFGFGGFGMHFLPLGVRAFVLPFAALLGGLILAKGVASLIAGWGLLDRRPWARALTLVLGIIELIHIPFGTALGIYTLWVLLPNQSAQEWSRLSSPA